VEEEVEREEVVAEFGYDFDCWVVSSDDPQSNPHTSTTTTVTSSNFMWVCFWVFQTASAANLFAAAAGHLILFITFLVRLLSKTLHIPSEARTNLTRSSLATFISLNSGSGIIAFECIPSPIDLVIMRERLFLRGKSWKTAKGPTARPSYK